MEDIMHESSLSYIVFKTIWRQFILCTGLAIVNRYSAKTASVKNSLFLLQYNTLTLVYTYMLYIRIQDHFHTN